jgi:hypothetical protein
LKRSGTKRLSTSTFSLFSKLHVHCLSLDRTGMHKTTRANYISSRPHSHSSLPFLLPDPFLLLRPLDDDDQLWPQPRGNSTPLVFSRRPFIRLQLPLGRIPNIPGGTGNTTRFLRLFENLLAESPCSMTDGLSKVRDLSTLGLVVVHETRHIRALSATLGSAMVIGEVTTSYSGSSVTMRKAMADSRHGPCRTLSGTTVLGSESAAEHALPGTHGPSRTLSATLVSAVVDPPTPNSFNGSSRSPGQCLSMAFFSVINLNPSNSSDHGSSRRPSSVAAHAPPSIHGPSHTLTALGCIVD